MRCVAMERKYDYAFVRPESGSVNIHGVIICLL